MRAQPSPIRVSIRNVLLAGLCVAGLAAGMAAPAQAERPLISKVAVNSEKVPSGQIEGACGLAAASEKIYVSDYYHHAIDVFTTAGMYESQISTDPVDGACGLATSSDGALYANDWHESVSRVLPTGLAFDSEESTGVAVDQVSGDVYVDDRTYIAVYEPSGAAVLNGAAEPLQIGLGTLGEGYGLAVAPSGKVYVPDASDQTVKVYEPATDPDPVNPQVIDGAATPQGRFVSLVDAAVAVDPSNEHLLVLDNLQPGFEFPMAAVEEFDATGNFLGQVKQKVIDGEPSGMAFGEGRLYVTSGNSEQAGVYSFGAYTAAPSLMFQPAPAPAPAMTKDAPDVAQSAAVPAPEAATQALRLSSAIAAGDGDAIVTALLPTSGTLTVVGRGLRPLRRHVRAGRRVLRLHLSPAGERALARAKLGELKVRARVGLTPDAGAALTASKTVIFKTTNGEAR